jgi:anti-anti-sigma factor
MSLNINALNCWHRACNTFDQSTLSSAEYPMSIQLTSTGSEVTAILVGELTMNTMDSYLAMFVELSMQGWNDVVLDMTGISSLDTAGAGLLLALRDRLAGQGLELRLSCPQPGPMLLLQQTGLDHAMVIEMDRTAFQTLH